MKSGKLVLGVLAGLAVGAIAGILFAPDKGSKTRKKMLSKGKVYVGGLQDKFDEFVDNLSKKQEDGGELVSNGKTN